MPARKAVIGLVSFAVLSIAATWSYVAARTFTDFESLLLCSQGKDEWVPKAICQAYLFRFGIEPADIEALNSSTGVGWVIRAEDEDDRRKLLAFLLRSGVDINALDRRSGITALHTAVIENDLYAVELLLSYGANPAVGDLSRGKTPLEFALELGHKSKQPNRSAIVERLRAATVDSSPRER